MSTTTPHRHLDLSGDPPPGAIHPGEVGTERPVEAEPARTDGYLLVGDLARATGKTVRAIHLYEDLGLLRPHERSKGRYRLFSVDSVARVRWITKLQSLGLSLTEIQDLVRSHAGQDSAMFAAARLREVFTEKLREAREKLRELTLLEAELAESLEYLSTCDTSCLPELSTESCQCCARHKEPGDAPELVAGVRAY
ncbi:MAG: MerR family transcriptional regulator [Polyangiaceae bacterium]|nr:MerR family transcriptional regulator [Polyangiaceae bacterium]